MNKIPNNQGFTLLELLVAVAIFSVVMTVASGVLSNILQSQERVLAEQLALNNTSYALEYMGRSLRMAKKDADGQCLDEYLENFNDKCNYAVSGDSSIRFLNHDKECVEYFLKGNQVKKKKSDNETDSFGGAQAFTSNDLTISKLNFEIKGECQDDNLQPTVTIFMNVETSEETDFKIQTTITQRNLDFPSK